MRIDSLYSGRIEAGGMAAGSRIASGIIGALVDTEHDRGGNGSVMDFDLVTALGQLVADICIDGCADAQ